MIERDRLAHRLTVDAQAELAAARDVIAEALAALGDPRYDRIEAARARAILSGSSQGATEPKETGR